MKSYSHYVELGKQRRVEAFIQGKLIAPKDVCPTNEPTWRSAFFKGWNALTPLQLEVEARLQQSKEL
ncbi:hypothetical protein [Pseudoalteromonas maricaloris]|uniref:hypothetical protein n=1 Tax=Pseudoalteromonas maricaloris TaxID=184924 RepID=UPI00029A155D|nr:hypothetical protein [Pseudoalteromonas flavipulchra]